MFVYIKGNRDLLELNIYKKLGCQNVCKMYACKNLIQCMCTICFRIYFLNLSENRNLNDNR